MSDNIGALWLQEGKSGKFFSGSIEIDGIKHEIVVFKNAHKKEDKHPDYKIFPRTKKKESSSINDDDIPF